MEAHTPVLTPPARVEKPCTTTARRGQDLGGSENHAVYVLFLKLHHSSYIPQHFLYFLPLPQGQGSLRPTFLADFLTGCFLRCVVRAGLAGDLGYPLPLHAVVAALWR
jgi:hypothetical protein